MSDSKINPQDVNSETGSGASSACDVDGGLTSAAHRREAPGVPFSNTPPQSSINNKNESQWVAAEDWFEWTFYVDWGKGWGKLKQRLERAKENAGRKNCPDKERSLLFWGGRALVDRMGARLGSRKSGLYFAYKLNYADVLILIADQQEPHKTKPSVIVRATGEVCLFSGARAAYEDSCRFVSALGGRVCRNKLSRVDICLDMPGLVMTPFDRAYIEERYIYRARSHGRYSSQGITISFGKYPSMLRIYDKLAEVKMRKNPLQTLGMVERRWGGSMPESAIRVEFEIGRDFLKKKGIDSVEDYYAKRGALLNYLTKRWFRFALDRVDRKNKNQQKAETLPLWQQVRDALLAWAGRGEGVSLAPLDKSKADVSHLIKVAVGVTKTAAVDQEQAFLKVDDFMRYLEERIRLYGISVKTEE